MAKNLKEILSPRQYEVVVGLAQGFDNSDIANSMGTTTGNVSMLLTTICKRVGIKSKEGISLREQLVNFVNENMSRNERIPAIEDAMSEYAGGGAMSEDVNTCDSQLTNSTVPANEAIKRISESVDCVEIVQKINSKLDELYRHIGKEYVNGSVANDRDVEFVRKAKMYKTALDVIAEVMKDNGKAQ